MSGFTSANTEHLTRANVWSTELKELLEDDLQAMQYVKMLTEFPDGDTFNIPSIGQAEVDDYVENTEVKFRAMDTGNFTFSITDYVTSATYITDKEKQDFFYPEIIAAFVPKMQRAINVRIEKDIMALGNTQTLSDKNEINGAAHRFVGSSTVGSVQQMAVADFAAVLFSLKKANVPQTQLVGIVDPSVEYYLNTLTNLVDVSNNPKWEGIVADGIATGMKFSRNVYGIDLYTSNYIADAGAETIGTRSVTAGKANMFFSAAGDVLPFVGAMRQMPMVESQRNMTKLRDEYIVSTRYGFKLYRPENLVVVLTDGAAGPDFG